jgi:hypothetical protein
MPIPQHNQNLFSSTLSSGDFALLEPDLTTIEMRAGDSLHRIGEQVQHVVLPHSGLVAMTLPINRGTSMEVALIGREGVMGGFLAAASVPASSNAEVRIPGSASRISAKAFCDAFARSVSLQMHVSRFNNALMAQVQQSALCNAVHVVDARLCRWLLEMQDRSGDKLPLMQKSLARCWECAARLSLSRSASCARQEYSNAAAAAYGSVTARRLSGTHASATAV